MKIIVTANPLFNHASSIVNSLKQLGHNVLYVKMHEFYCQCSYVERRLYKLGCKNLETSYNQKWNKNFISVCEQFCPDIVLTLNGVLFEPVTLQKLHDSGIKSILWLVDGLCRLKNEVVKLGLYDSIYSFEKDDVQRINEYGLTANYCPLGYESDVYYPIENLKRDIDISFLGMPTGNRMMVLQQIAQYALENGRTMALYGPWWQQRYFWKKWNFAKKSAPLIKYTHNGLFTAKQAAELYRRSKICLNIHALDHNGLNPRTFEVLGTRSFELMDHRPNLDELIRPGTDLVMYDDVDDLLNKIDYYLEHEQEREQIAANGYNWVKERFTVIKMVKKLIE